jgi:acyl-ACP thioesterase
MELLNLKYLKPVDKDEIYREDFRNYTYNEDTYLTAKLSWFFELTQEMAAFHGYSKHCSIPEFHKLGYLWVITGEHMIVDRYTNWLEPVHLETWVQEPNGVFVPRTVRATDINGKRIFEAHTFWAILDIKTFRPLSPSRILDRIIGPKDNPKYPSHCDSQKRASKLMAREENLKELFVSDLPVTYGMTDSNQHVNNVSYINWILSALPNDFRDAYKVKDINVSWLKQTFLSDQIHLHTYSSQINPYEQDKPSFYHLIFKKEKDGSETKIFEARTEWRHRAELEIIS